MKSLSLSLIAITLISACASSKKIINYSQKENEIITNKNLTDFFIANKSPNIVLRVPNTSDKATSNTSTGPDNNILYNAIEKEFLRQGYSVRDRGLFNEIIDKSGSTDYSKIKDLTNTDLILEVVNIDPKVIYSTNKVTIKTSKKPPKTLAVLITNDTAHQLSLGLH